ncbi:MAG: M14 family metallopeptidase [Bacteroidota bacterium]
MPRFAFALLAALLVAVPTQAQRPQAATSAYKALGAPNSPQVEVAWNRYYDHAGVTAILQALEAAYPDLATVESIGQSHEGRDLWVMTITDPATGAHDTKPAMFIDAGIHANEIQTVEVALYTAWYLLESHATNAWIQDLLRTKTFYIVPGTSPDSRDAFFAEPNTANTPRTGQVPLDNDGDGLTDEDPPDDLDGDGHITMMRRAMPGGRWKKHPDDDRLMIRCEIDEACGWQVWFTEGYDNDGDGALNEDGDGYYDPNRNWGWGWAPHYTQRGSHHYPFSLPETRAVADFIKAHPNILGGQSYHNTGGMILRGPGVEGDPTYRRDDVVMQRIAEVGEQMLPGYESLVIWDDLYTVYGGETDWMYYREGILPFTNELFTPYNLFRTESEGGFFGAMADFYRFDELLLFGDGIVPWTEVEHPDWGTVEVGGMKKTFRRMPPSFLLEEEAHRNMAFTLLHAYELPVLEVVDVETKALGGGLTEVTATIVNRRTVPTRLEVDTEHGITRPDWVTLSGAEVLASGVKRSRLDDVFAPQASRPERVSVEAVPGHGAVTVAWIVRGGGPYTVTVDSQKGGRATMQSEG